MGNKDGIYESMVNYGYNEVININQNIYFSFAYGDEIALVINYDKYFILNCDSKLWTKVKAKVSRQKNIVALKKWWYEQSKKYPISDWSGNFEDLLTEGDG